MRPTFIHLTTFVEQWNRLKLSDDELRELEDALSPNPLVGDVIPGTGGLRKLRFAPRSLHRGKRGGMRVCYAYFVLDHEVYLFTIYSKVMAEDLTPERKKRYAKVLAALREFKK